MTTKTYEEVLDECGFLYWRTVGVSMRPLIREGLDSVLIERRPAGRLGKYDVALFRRPGVVGRGEYILHRVLKVNADGSYYIEGDNCTSGETVLEENILGVLNAVVRKGKKLSVTAFPYRVYVALWCKPYHLRRFLLRARRFGRRVLSKVYHTLKGDRRK